MDPVDFISSPRSNYPGDLVYCLATSGTQNYGLCCMVLSAILGVDYTLKPSKIQKVVMSARITNQEKHCDYVIHGYSTSIKQKMYSVMTSTCLFASV